MVSITHFLRNTRFDVTIRRIIAFALFIFMLSAGALTSAAELRQLKVERGDDGVYLSAIVEFEISPVVEDAMSKGIPMFFVVETDIFQSRWYWADKRVSSAARTIRLAFQPLTRRWRVNIVNGLINNSVGLRATLNQNYDTLPEAMSAVQRLSNWKIADNVDIEPDAVNKIEFSFRLDLSQLPRPFQIGVAGQRDWNISVQESSRIQIAPLKASSVTPEKAKAVLPSGKEADR